jgi:Mycoplasma protein of unknown function, DUF285
VELTVIVDHLQELHPALLLNILSFLIVTWLNLCKKTILIKEWSQWPKSFSIQPRIKIYAVEKYCKQEAGAREELACTYGYPIDKWDVSHIMDMSKVFWGMDTFNEYIGSWDVSSVTTMRDMFHGAGRFNQDIGSWDVCRVTNMSCMFRSASFLTKTLDLGMNAE